MEKYHSLLWGYKPSEEHPHYMIRCQPDDPEATKFEVIPPGMFIHDAVKCATRAEAENFRYMFERAYDAGRRARSKEISDMLMGLDLRGK